jgi:serine/threonine protein kinase
MKWVEGRSLHDLIDERATLDERLALLPHVIAIADALAYAHAVGVIHRDLKPANVLVGAYGETIVIDWGLALERDGADLPAAPAEPVSAPRLTSVGAVIGTPAYMPPEQARGERVGPAADIYALGATLSATRRRSRSGGSRSRRGGCCWRSSPTSCWSRRSATRSGRS